MDMVHKFFKPTEKEKVTNLVFESAKILERNDEIRREQGYQR